MRRVDGAAPHGVVGREAAPRWVWADTAAWYPRLLADGVRVERCLDLRLAHRVLRHAPATAAAALATAPAGPFDQPTPGEAGPVEDALFVVDEPQAPPGEELCLAELVAQDQAVAAAAAPARLRLLLAAESAGALAAAEMHHAGVPWDTTAHDEVLAGLLGPRPRVGERPARLEELAATVRAELDAPALNPDSLPDVLRALRRTGLPVTSTRTWELKHLDHPAIAPLLEYKKLSRLHAANGWAWLDTWVSAARFRPEYVVGGVVTGRWGSSGGGALQLPRQLRGAVRADEGWSLVVADAAQLEPRVLAGLAHDERLAAAGRGHDLYDAMVATGVVTERKLAKVGMLGALYGGTTGPSADVLPRLARAYPDALAYVEAAARAGERGEVVATLLGRGSPPPGGAWLESQAEALADDAGVREEARARSISRGWGRFTRNFVVQGTAAEWALAWIADVRRRLWAMGESGAAGRAAEPFTHRPHLVYFLHDELVVHVPSAWAQAAADEVRASAATAGRLLFGDFPVEFPLSVGIADRYGDAKG
ncbi:MAG TPA: bifunctional 3'-5' exonuclease/DNA polymerase [Cellulomonas sp.]